MAVDNKVSIEIVLDDGSVKRGFATIKKEAKETGDQVEEGLNTPIGRVPQSLVKIGAAFGALTIAVAAVAKAIEKAFDFVIAGERIQALEGQFNNLAESAGLSGQQLRDGLAQAADGLIDTGDLLEIASTRVAQFGANAQRLPELLQAARQVALGTGRDIKDVFDQLSQGIANGNSRALRQLGVFTDLDAAANRYAASLGKSADQLTDQERQAAALNATLEQVSRRFGNVDTSLRPVSDAVQRLNVQTSEAFENLSRVASDLFGPGFAAVANAVTAALERFNTSIQAQGTGVDATAAKIRELNSEIESLQRLQAAPLQNANLVASLGGVSGVANEIQRLRSEISLLTVSQQALSDEQQIAQARTLALKAAEDQRTQTIETQAASLKKRADLEITFGQQVLQAQQANLQQRIALLSSAEQNEQVIDARINELKNQAALVEQQRLQREAEIRKQFSVENGFTAEEQTRLITLAKENERLQIEAINAQIVEAEKSKNTELLNAQKIATNAQQQSQAALVKITQTTFATLGAALVQGKNAWSNFGQAILGIIGDLLINIGTSILTTSLAIDALSKTLTTLFGGFGIAAGLGLIALGGALKSAAGGSLTSAATSGATTDLGVGATQEAVTQPLQETERERRADTVINVNFEGDVIGDSADSGARIVSLINSAFDRQGVVLRQGVV